MRTFFWVLGLFALAVGLVIAGRYNSGYVLFVFPTHRIELSVNFAVFLLAIVFGGLYLLVRTLSAVLSLPSRARTYHEQQRVERGREAFMSAVRNYFEGRSGRAEQAAADALNRDYAPALSAVIAARAAHEKRAFDARDQYLARLDDLGDDFDYLRRVTHAELLLDERRYLDALAVLEKIKVRHTASLRLELKAHQLARNWDRVEALLPALDKRNIYDPVALAQLRRTATVEMLKRRAIDLERLREAWREVPQDLMVDELVARVAAECFLGLDAGDEARRIIENALEKHWDAQMVMLYAEGLGDDVHRQIQRAEAWLPKHPREAVLLLTLGRLCAHAELWGKARSYFEASLAIEPSHTAHIELAKLSEQAGEEADARAHVEAALELALGQIEEVTGGRRRRLL